MSEIIIYEDPDITRPVQVTLEGETVWLAQSQMAELFQVKPQNVTMHLKNIYNGGELDEAATCKDFLQVQTEGARRVERSRKLYNLDAIISVGYRVKSQRGVRFRQWASSVLRPHLLHGYTLNQRRLAVRGPDRPGPAGGRKLAREQGSADPSDRQPAHGILNRCLTQKQRLSTGGGA